MRDKQSRGIRSGQPKRIWFPNDILVQHVSTHTPRSPREIFNLVRNDWGTVSERTLWRHLALALQKKRVVRQLSDRALARDNTYTRSRR